MTDPNVPEKEKPCWACDGEGFVMDYMGGCGDPECCGGPWPVKCNECDNDWEPG